MNQRICPECGGNMYEEIKDDIKMDKCINCRGIFLDFTELKIILDQIENKDHSHLNIDQIEKGNFNIDHHLSNFKCANCGSEMEEREYNYGSGNHIDFCKICGGIYLSKGELEQIENHEISRQYSIEGRQKLDNISNLGKNTDVEQNFTLNQIEEDLKDDVKLSGLKGLIHRLFVDT